MKRLLAILMTIAMLLIAAVEGKTVSQATEIAQIYIPLGELVDIEKEKARLQAEIERVKGEIERADGKLANRDFVAKAPKKLVDNEREKLEKYREEFLEVLRENG